MHRRPSLPQRRRSSRRAARRPPPPKPGLDRIEHIVVIYAENRSFDHLYGLFPGANGIANATAEQYTQVDRDGKPLPHLPPVWKGKSPDPAYPSGLPNRPFRHRRAAGQHAAHRAHARHDPQVLSAAGADRRRPQRSLRRGVRLRCAGDGLLRRLVAADVEARAGIRARGQLLHGGVRRFVPEPLLARLRLHAGRSEGTGKSAGRSSTAAAGSAHARFAGVCA